MEIIGCQLDGFAVDLVGRDTEIVGHHPLAALVGEQGRVGPADDATVAGKMVVRCVDSLHTLNHKCRDEEKGRNK